MQAYLVTRPGGPEVLELQNIPDPIAQIGQVHIAIKAFGLNRAEAVTRMGGSGAAVPFPRVIGIECVGTVLACPGGELAVGQTVAAAMGEMGRKYDGSYAEQTVVPVNNVFPLETRLDWTTLAAIPETYFTAWGCCFESLQLSGQPRVLVRPGASALGIAITQLVNQMGGSVIGVKRSAHKVARLKAAGMAAVLVTGGAVADQVFAHWPEGATGVVDTIASATSIADDLALLAPEGRLCVAGSLAGSYGTGPAAELSQALSRDNVGFYSSEHLSVAKDGAKLQTIVDRVGRGEYQPHIDRVYDFADLRMAHQAMDANAFAGKVVIRVAE